MPGIRALCNLLHKTLWKAMIQGIYIVDTFLYDAVSVVLNFFYDYKYFKVSIISKK